MEDLCFRVRRGRVGSGVVPGKNARTGGQTRPQWWKTDGWIKYEKRAFADQARTERDVDAWHKYEFIRS
jgi:hypothetical protein